ncbi:MAG: preprotein translocase subunit SecY [Candidatus Gastranaerophilaceae bacterium]|jgi:preprotein translocase subunit SecY|nr:preprotein translocase subunit SecY [bacterium]MEE0495472.1 preprotein translocase subunit SecY [Cyanobacteriota bacterium]CDE91974.1 protein translocase subunit SecY [Fusobacterium sp. CAG:815]DAA93301.1 MAG TPA: preprotein translocase subunit SecY [Candidatus Gastranaerophilales bacterium HUM_6]DAA96207.1 MAG TPA: preprotein translocase subunit SecY [Candidatus Gastranaerophilales bacterium HUM_7]DAB03169.1 MAG TPA: preprotein translocase subunit SecY [Candidatus Gastranaerophilales bacte
MAQGVKMPTTDDLMSMWNASGLKQKILFTFLMIAVWRFGVQMPLYGINNQVFSNIAQGNNIIGFLDLFSGGALGKVSILALGIGPFITSSIIVQLVSVVIPSLEKLQKEEGEAGRRKLSQYTRLFTVVLGIFQSFIFMLYLHHLPGAIMSTVSPVAFYASSVCVLTAGAVLVMWISELITENGIGNGGSLIIFCGILSGIPIYASRTMQLVKSSSQMQIGLMVLLAIFFLAMILIVIMQEAVRKVIIVNPKRQIGNKVYGGMNSFIPFKLNPGGVMPIIFAIAILLFPSTILALVGQANFKSMAVKNFVMTLNQYLSPNGITYYLLYVALIIALTFFYASIMPNMQPKDIADNLKKYGSSIPGIKPGRPTAEALDKILSKTTFIGALGLGIIALVPSFASYATHIETLQGIGATSLIIMVGVALDLINQVRTHLLARNYESFLKE